jgi:hypothetical protein
MAALSSHVLTANSSLTSIIFSPCLLFLQTFCQMWIITAASLWVFSVDLG